MPAVVSCDKGDLKVRKPNVRGIMQAKKAAVDVRAAAVGASTVRVVGCALPPPSPRASPTKAVPLLRTSPVCSVRRPTFSEVITMSETVIIAETAGGAVAPSTAELVTAAVGMGANPTVVVPCTDASVANAAAFAGVGRVIAAKSDVFAAYDAAAWAQAIDAVAPQGTVIALASARSKDLAARLAARRDLPVVQDVVGINGAQLTSPILSGKAMQTVEVDGASVITLRANVFAAADAGGGADVSVVDATGDVRTAVVEMMARASERLDVAEANIIVSGGRGMGDPGNFSHLETLADTIGAAVGASRAAVDTWDEIPHSMQVGQTGKTVNPNLYIAVGISGAIQHLAGMRSSKYIVAINKDADAPIFKHADYGIVATWEEALPVLTSTLSGMMS